MAMRTPVATEPTQLLAEARAEFQGKDPRRGAALYERLLAEHHDTLWRNIAQPNGKMLTIHKEFVRDIIALQIIDQGEYENGFTIDLKSLLPNYSTNITLKIGRATVLGFNEYKAPSKFITEKVTGYLAERYDHAPRTLAINVIAAWIIPDLVDVLLFMPNPKRLVDIGAGSGIHAMVLAAGKPVESIHTFEILDAMKLSIAELAELNGRPNVKLNEKPAGEVDGYYSFKACGFLFSFSEYIDVIRATAGPNAKAIFDIGHHYSADLQLLRSVFQKQSTLHTEGLGDLRHDRIAFSRI